MISTWPPKLPQNPPTAAPGFTWFEDDQAVAAAKGVRATGHRLDRDTAPTSSPVRDRIGRVDHQILVHRLHPDGDTGVPARRLEVNPKQSVGVRDQVRKCRIHSHRPDRTQFEEI